MSYMPQIQQNTFSSWLFKGNLMTRPLQWSIRDLHNSTFLIESLLSADTDNHILSVAPLFPIRDKVVTVGQNQARNGGTVNRTRSCFRGESKNSLPSLSVISPLLIVFNRSPRFYRISPYCISPALLRWIAILFSEWQACNFATAGLRLSGAHRCPVALRLPFCLIAPVDDLSQTEFIPLSGRELKRGSSFSGWCII